jgi:DNA polymerase I
LEVQVEYGIQDADLTFDLAANNNFLILGILDYLANFVGMSLEEVCNNGPNVWWESYYKNVMHVEPSPNAIKKKVGEKYKGGDVAKVEEIKEYRNVAVFDFKQQYPSLAKAKNVSFDTVNCGHSECANDPKAKIITGQPEIDTKGYYTCRKNKGSYPRALEVLTELRDTYKAEYKKALQAGDTERAHEFDIKQNTMKIISNTGYGVFGESHFAYGDVRTAEIITALGRTKVNKLKDLINNEDAFPGLAGIYRDTDSAFIIGIEGQLSKDNTTVKKILEQANKPEKEGGLGIPLEYEKWYSKVLIYASKNYMGVNGDTGELVVKGLVGKKSNQCELVKEAFKQVREFWKDDADNSTIEAYIKPIVESLDNKTVDISKLEERSKIGHDPKTGYLDSPKRPEKVLGIKHGKRVNESITFWHKVKNGEEDYFFTEDPAEIDYVHYKEPLKTALKPILTIRGYSADQIDELLNVTPKSSIKKPRKSQNKEEKD